MKCINTFWLACFGFIVFNATFNNISVIMWRSDLLVVETGGPRENHRSVGSHWQTLSHNVVLLAIPYDHGGPRFEAHYIYLSLIKKKIIGILFLLNSIKHMVCDFRVQYWIFRVNKEEQWEYLIYIFLYLTRISGGRVVFFWRLQMHADRWNVMILYVLIAVLKVHYLVENSILNAY